MKQFFLKFNTFLLLIATSISIPALAQDEFEPFSAVSVGIKASTLGYGIEAATPLSNMFIARLGVNFTGGLTTPSMDIVLPDDDDALYNAFGYAPDYRAKLGMSFTHANLLVDFHPAGIFHVTAGLFVGASKFKIEGHLVDHNGNPAVLKDGYHWPSVQIEDQELVLEGGRANIDLQLGSSPIKPYLGLGVGRAISKNGRVAFKFEMGALLQNGYSIKQDGREFDLSNSTSDDIRDAHDIISKLNFWPMMNFQLSYRIF